MKSFLNIFFSFLISFYAIAQKNKSIVVATYNLRYDTESDGENAWSKRKELVKNLINFHEFDIFGTQEALRGQLDYLGASNTFLYVGVGRDDGKEKGEHSAIFYRKDRFKVLESGNFWLSQTPEIPGKGWDATCCNRICSWAKFKDLTTKKQFYFFNVHFDHQGIEARKQSGYLMVKKMQEIAKNNTIICTGDFNSLPNTEQIQHINSFLNDAKIVSKMPPYGPEGTFNGFRFDAPLEERIDYIFVSKNIEVLKYGVLTDTYKKHYPSDHQPVIAKIVLK